MQATVRQAFRDSRSWLAYVPGDTYDGGPARVAELAEAGLVEAERDLSGMTVAELAALCSERGLTPPRKATKAQLLQLLAE